METLLITTSISFLVMSLFKLSVCLVLGVSAMILETAIEKKISAFSSLSYKDDHEGELVSRIEEPSVCLGRKRKKIMLLFNK